MNRRERIPAQVHRFGDSVALYLGTGETVYLTPKEARRREILESIRDDDRRGGWRIVAVTVNWEDSALVCDHTGERIESAYGEEVAA